MIDIDKHLNSNLVMVEVCCPRARCRARWV